MSGGSATRFAKGQSGNPKGRPKGRSRQSSSATSAFDIIIDQRLKVVQNGIARTLTVDEALQLKTYQEALGGSRSAQSAVLKMIAKRETWIADHQEPPAPAPVRTETEEDPLNAHAALLLLGLVSPDRSREWRADDLYDRLLLEPWAVEAALHRLRGCGFKAWDLSEMRRCTRDSGSIAWPEAIRQTEAIL